MSGIDFARRVFLIAGIYGVAVLPPLYFLEDRVGRDYPPAITHPVYFYGFIGVALAWQVAFLVISRDPLRHRPIMIPAILEKVSFGVAAIVLFLLGRMHAVMLAAGVLDLILGALYVAAYARTSGTMSDVSASAR